MGNTHANALPRCQLEKIRTGLIRSQGLDPDKLQAGPGSKSVRGGSPSPFATVFWMDTLCIALPHFEREPSKAIQRASIDKMAFIYSGAKNVLILDDELQEIMLKTIDNTQAIAHVICSAWMSRCWTYQEARLAEEWMVLFKDNIFRSEAGLTTETHLRPWRASGRRAEGGWRSLLRSAFEIWMRPSNRPAQNFIIGPSFTRLHTQALTCAGESQASMMGSK